MDDNQLNTIHNDACPDCCSDIDMLIDEIETLKQYYADTCKEYEERLTNEFNHIVEENDALKKVYNIAVEFPEVDFIGLQKAVDEYEKQFGNEE